jgi:membrane glycosyltransferase
MGMLILPKMLAYIVMLTHKDQRKKFGGGFRAFAGILAETFLSGLTAPVMMIFQFVCGRRDPAGTRCGLAGSTP